MVAGPVENQTIALSAISVRQSRRAIFQSESGIPNRVLSLSQFNREFLGRGAGSGYSAVVTGINLGRLIDLRNPLFSASSIAFANPCHEVKLKGVR